MTELGLYLTSKPASKEEINEKTTVNKFKNGELILYPSIGKGVFSNGN